MLLLRALWTQCCELDLNCPYASKWHLALFFVTACHCPYQPQLHQAEGQDETKARKEKEDQGNWCMWRVFLPTCFYLSFPLLSTVDIMITTTICLSLQSVWLYSFVCFVFFYYCAASTARRQAIVSSLVLKYEFFLHVYLGSRASLLLHSSIRLVKLRS